MSENRWAKGIRTPDLLHACSQVSSDSVALGPVVAVQNGTNVRGRLARSGEIWGRWSLDWSWFSPDLSVNGGSTLTPGSPATRNSVRSPPRGLRFSCRARASRRCGTLVRRMARCVRAQGWWPSFTVMFGWRSLSAFRACRLLRLGCRSARKLPGSTPFSQPQRVWDVSPVSSTGPVVVRAR